MIPERLRRGPAYLAVSVTCVLLNNALLIALDRLSVHYVLSVLISAAVMIPFSFGLHARFTYAVEPSAASFARYASVLIVNTPMAWLLFFIIHDRGGLAMTFAAPIVTGILFVWNFAASDWAIAAQPRGHFVKDEQ
jgi:putative flippase GtrA